MHLKLARGLSNAVRMEIRERQQGESLAIFDLLKEPELKPAEIKKINRVTVELLQTLKVEKLKVDHWRDKEGTRDVVLPVIIDFLWNEEAGLPTNKGGCFSSTQRIPWPE